MNAPVVTCLLTTPAQEAFPVGENSASTCSSSATLRDSLCSRLNRKGDYDFKGAKRNNTAKYAKAHRSLRTPAYPRLHAYTCMGGSNVDALMLSIAAVFKVSSRYVCASWLLTSRHASVSRHASASRFIRAGVEPHVSCTTSNTRLVYVFFRPGLHLVCILMVLTPA